MWNKLKHLYLDRKCDKIILYVNKTFFTVKMLHSTLINIVVNITTFHNICFEKSYKVTKVLQICLKKLCESCLRCQWLKTKFWEERNVLTESQLRGNDTLILLLWRQVEDVVYTFMHCRARQTIFGIPYNTWKIYTRRPCPKPKIPGRPYPEESNSGKAASGDTVKTNYINT